jgi:ABC-type branched-subunit amino acid transport system ATPase component
MVFLLPLCSRFTLPRFRELMWEGDPTSFVRDPQVLEVYLGTRSAVR